jgi:hypothetical protein
MKFIIYWDAGFGEEYDLIDADTEDDAEEVAYHSWLETAESNASYGAKEATPDNLEEYGFDEEAL